MRQMKNLISKSLAAMLVLSTQGYAAGLCTSGPCQLPTGGESGNRTDNRVYAGLSWELSGNQGLLPNIQVGFRALQVKSSDTVNGGDISLRLKLGGGLQLDSTRLVYVGGNRDVQGDLGVGYSFASSGFLGTAAIQRPYLKIGSDFMFGDHLFKPYVEINSLAKPNQVQGGLSCGPGYSLVNANDIWGNGSNVIASPSVTSNGKTCHTNFT